MKKLLLFIVLIFVIIINNNLIHSKPYSIETEIASSENKLFTNNEDDNTEIIDTIKILTPLGHQPNDNRYGVTNKIWSDTVIEQCNQAWLFSGGLFKKDTGTSTFTEMNNYLSEQRVRCMEIDGDNIYIGTDNGIYLSTNHGDTWLEQANDEIDNLPGKKINAISVGTNKIFTGTDSGIHVSTDSGVSWEHFLNDRVITCIEYGIGDTIYAGVKISYPGVYKSTDYGENWDTTGLKIAIYCLKYDASNLYAGTGEYQGLKKTTNGGANWTTLWSLDKVTSIYIDSSDIYIGTNKKGCYLSTNGGAFVEKNNNLPKIDPNYYYTLNSLQKFDDSLYAATENGLYKSELSSISWLSCDVRDNYFRYGTNSEKLTKMVYIDNTPNPDELWIACWGEQKWKSATMIRDRAYPLNPPNFPNYLCHTFAWHLSEGGESGVSLVGPNSMKYIPWGADSIGWGKENWDYIKTDWNDTLWDKVTYDWAHSGIKSLKNNPNISHEDSLIIESKWFNKGPLVEHKLRDYPYETGSTIRYWKSKKTVTDTITEDNRIGRQIMTEGVTIIPSNDTVEFYVAPMIEHKIQLKPGFHAKRGSTFHAFVKDYYIDSGVVKPCKIPWEEDPVKFSLKDDLADSYYIIPTQFANSVQVNSLEAISTVATSKENIEIKSDTDSCVVFKDNFKYSGKGSGTEKDPYQITAISDFKEMMMDFTGEHYWILMNDIDASETRYWNPKVLNGDTLYYEGFGGITGKYHRSLDGRGHVFRNLYKCQNSRIELFSSLNCFTIKRLGFENLLFEGAPTSFLSIGHENKDFIMEECYITGKFTGTQWNQSGSNGFGPIYNGAIVRNCYSDLILISDSMVTNFSISDPNDKEGIVLNCYAVGKAISPKVNSPFGPGGNVISCFWDNEKILVTEQLGKGLGLSTADMMKRSTFESAGWDFEKVWYIDEGKDYPKLRAFLRDTTDVKDYINPEYFIVSPNPATDFIEIPGFNRRVNPTVDNSGIKIFNVYGQNCDLTPALTTSGEGVRIDVSGLARGMYFVRIGDRVSKFVKL